MKMKTEEEKSRIFFNLCYEVNFWYIKTSNLANIKYVIIVAIPILVMKIQFSKFGLKYFFDCF